MANVIDALVTTLTLDNTGFRKGTREALADQQKIREAGKSTADSVQSANQRMAQSFTTVRNEVVGLFLALAGARTIKDFTANIINGDAATGRLATNLGIATDKLSAWEGAIGRVGGNAKSADAALQSMVSAVQDFKLTGNSAIAPDLMGLGVTQFNDPSQMLLQIAKAGERMNKPEFAARLARLGFDQDTINLLGKGRDGVEQLLREQEKLGVVTDRDAKAAQDFQDAMSRLTSAIKGELRPEITLLVNGLVGFLGGLERAHLLIPALEIALGGLALAATAAAAPWIALAAAIAFALASPAQRREVWESIKSGQWKRDFMAGFGGGEASPDNRSTADIRGGGFLGYQGRSGGGGGSDDVEQFFRGRGYSAERARGIAAGVHAEGGHETAFNGAGGGQGAFGIGQWRGPRLRELRRRYGNHPSRRQQLEYLAWELEGGDPGGAAVRAATTAQSAARAYITAFMRPGAGTAGDLRRANQFLGGNPRMVSARGSSSSSVSIGAMTVVSPNPQSFANRDLPDALRNRGLIIQSQRGVTP